MVTKRFITVSASANVDDTGRGTGETNLAFHFLDIQKKKKVYFNVEICWVINFQVDLLSIFYNQFFIQIVTANTQQSRWKVATFMWLFSMLQY